MAIDTAALFADMGKAFFAMNTAIAALKTTGTVATETEDYTAEVGAATIAFQNAVAAAAAAVAPIVNAGQSYNTTIRQTISNLMIQYVKTDNQQLSDGELVNLNELIRQMIADTDNQRVEQNEPAVVDAGQTVTAAGFAGDNRLDITGHGFINGDRLIFSTTTTLPDPLALLTIYYVVSVATNDFEVSLSPGGTSITGVDSGTGTHTATLTALVYGSDFLPTSASSANNGDGILNRSTLRGDGLVNEHILRENIEGKVTAISTNQEATFSTTSQLQVNKLSPDWPGGSGISTSLTSYVGASGINLVNGTFETTDTNEDDLPSGWIAVTATLGTTVNVTPIEVQTIEVDAAGGAGPPTSGWYTITHIDKDSNAQTTVPLVWNASGSAVQSALKQLNGLGNITVSTSGTTPAFTHTITFTGVTNPAAVTVDNNTDAGDFTVVTTVAGSANVMRGARSLQFTGTAGAEETDIAYPVTLQPATVYACSVWVMSDDVPASGAMAIVLTDSTDSTVPIEDDQGTGNQLSIDITAIDGTYTQYSAFFRTPTVLPNAVFLRILLSTAIADTDDVFVDELCLVPAVELYAGGPFVAMFTGPTDWASDDEFVFTPSNAQAGEVHTWLDRVFNLSGNRLLFDSTTDPGDSGYQDDQIIT